MKLNQSLLDDFIRALEATPSRLRGFVLLQGGEEAARHFWAPYKAGDPVWVYSLSKSFCSTAVGLAVDSGLFSVEDKVISFFPEYAAAVKDANCKAMKVKHLLTMNTGHETDTTATMVQSPDWAETFLSLPVKFKPGTHFVYNSGATYMLSAIVQKKTGMTVFDYLKPRLFKPLGFGRTAWDSSPQGINTGGWGFQVSVPDIAKLGQLYLNRGIWNGKRLLSEEWVKAAHYPHSDNSITPDHSPDWGRGYGYQFWKSKYGWRGDGAYGQYCLILPEFNAVLALCSETQNMQEILDIVWDRLVPALAAPPENPQSFNGTYKAAKNKAGVESASVTFDAGKLTLVLGGKTETRIEAGASDWLDSKTAFPSGAFSFIPVFSRPNEKLKISSTYYWTGAKAGQQSLEIRIAYRDGPHGEKIRLIFSGAKLTVQIEANLASGRSGKTAAEIRAER